MKNNAKSLFEIIKIEDGFECLKIQNTTTKTQAYCKEVSSEYIQLFFGLEKKKHA